jgi:hypothetical protein
MAASTNTTSIFQSNPMGGLTPPIFGPTFLGNLWFVNPATGANGNIGSQPQQPFQTLEGALNHVVPGNNDIVFFAGTISLTHTLEWNVNDTHLIGCGVPGEIGQTAKLSYTGSASLTPLVQVTGSGCLFSNFQASHAGTVASTAQVCWQDSSQHNVYDRVQFAGMGAAGQAGATGSRHLLIDGGAGQSTPTTGLGDLLFSRCTIGQTGTQRTAANANLEIQNASPRNVFRDSRFVANTSAAGALFLLCGASSLGDYTEIRDTLFINTIKNTSDVAMTQAFSINATQLGLILMKACRGVGMTKLETSASGFVYIDTPAVSATSFDAINNT